MKPLNRALVLAALTVNLASAPAVLAAAESSAKSPEAPEVPPAPVFNGPTLAALQLGLPILGALMVRGIMPETLNSVAYSGSLGSGYTGDYRPASVALLAVDSALLLPAYDLIGQSAAGLDQCTTTLLLSGLGAAAAFLAAGQPPFSSGSSGATLDETRINGALLGMGAGFLIGQIRSAYDLWVRADAMQLAHDRAVGAAQPEPDLLAHLALGQRSLESDVALGTLVNVAIPLLSFPVIALTSARTSGATSALGIATVGTITLLPLTSGLIHTVHADWSPAITRPLFGTLAVSAGGLIGLVAGAAVGFIPGRSVLSDAPFGALLGGLGAGLWWSIDSARQAAEKAQEKRLQASARQN